MPGETTSGRVVACVATTLDRYLADGWDVAAVSDGCVTLRRGSERISLVAQRQSGTASTTSVASGAA